MTRLPKVVRLLVLLILAGSFFGCESKTQPVPGKTANVSPPIPKVNQIKNIQASVYFASLKKKVTFTVPPELWNETLRGFYPARKDDAPAKWETLGKLDVVKNDGSEFKIYVFYLPGTEGAFAAGPTHESRIYYWGGNSKRMIAVLKKAYAMSSANETNGESKKKRQQ